MALSYYQQEYIKCAQDPIYFLNNYGYVFDTLNNQVGKMTCFPYQENVVRKYHKHKNNIILKSRQTGLSVITAGYVAWRLIFLIDEKILIVANEGVGAIRFLSTVKQFIEYLPNWLAPERPKWTEKRIELAVGENSKNFCEARASSPEAGRGESLTMLVLDETAFIKDAESIWMAAGMALSVTGGKCVMLSTPAGTGNLYHRTWTLSEKGKNDFVPTKVHWTENPACAKNLEKRKSEDGEEYLWSPWYEEQCNRLGDSVKIAQELDLSFEGSKRLAIEIALLTKYDNRLMTLRNEIVGYFDTKGNDGFVDYKTEFYIWKKPELDHKYIFGCDVARGDGTDFSTIQIFDVNTLEQVTEYCGKISPDLFAILIYKAANYYNKAYVAVECNSFGLGTAIDLNRKLNYTNMYFSKSFQEIYVRPYDYKVSENDEIPGFQTTRITRPLMVTNLIEHMREGSLKINSERLMNEFKTFINKDGKPQAEKGANDDLIMALCIALFVRDTDYKNSFESADFYKSMLNSFGYSSNSMDGKTITSFDEEIRDIKFEEKEFAGIMLNSEYLDTEQNEDLKWLYG